MTVRSALTNVYLLQHGAITTFTLGAHVDYICLDYSKALKTVSYPHLVALLRGYLPVFWSGSRPTSQVDFGLDSGVPQQSHREPFLLIMDMMMLLIPSFCFLPMR